MRVRDVMEPAAATIEADTPVEGVADLMRARHCDVLPVAERGRFLGLITADDVLLALVAPPAAGTTTSAQVVRRAPIHDRVMISGDESVSEAARMMASLHADHLAVVDGQEVIGLIRLADVAPRLGPGGAVRSVLLRPAGALRHRLAAMWQRVTHWIEGRDLRRRIGRGRAA